ncbi:hypothetical protein N7452_004834 [Penicillium brevicompactum]|uniref:Non-homologous end-joining factor 1 n=1 Tax=Penicillium brevicompactum TaxID=5074 RepID=A0A9W9UGU9_PENBR|nr:hypothetical protein N7452_004834 [Penicillium brevicompactum]
MPPRWNRLQLPNKDLPPLLFQYTWTQQGYEFYVTDLTYIWSERLPKKQIIKRAEEDVTTIDPGEDPEQLNVLLEKIGEALQNGTDSVTLSSGTQADSLEVRTTTKLPAPLKPLKWNLILAKEEPCYLTSKMLLPLLREEANWEVRQRSLLQQIKQKDSVISKFLDKIETIGVDLGSVFPSAAGSRASRKGVTRSEAARFVKGLEPFEEQSWLAEAGSSDGAGLATNLLQELADPGESHDDSATDRQGWWCQLTRSPEATPIHDKKNEQEAPQKHVDTEGESTASSDEDDGDFQRQETPPRLKSQPAKSYRSPPGQKSRKKSPSPAPLPVEPEDESTASDSDPEPEPRRSRIPTVSKSPEPPVPKPQEEPKRKKGGLGVIGGKKYQAAEPSVPPPQPRDSPGLRDTRASPEQNIRSEDPLPVSSTIPPATTTVKRTGKLGMIGGKAKAKAKDPVPHEASPPVPETQVPSPSQSSPIKPKDIHGATTKVVQKEETPLPELPPAEAPASVPPAELETDEQRADRRREELKRSLEAKSKVPAKKKRRF